MPTPGVPSCALGGVFIAADDNHAREPMCFSSQITWPTPLVREVGECFTRMLGMLVASLSRKETSWAEIDEPAGSAAKRLMTSRAAAAFSARMVTMRWRRVSIAFAIDVVDIEQVVVLLLEAERGEPGFFEERLLEMA